MSDLTYNPLRRFLLKGVVSALVLSVSPISLAQNNKSQIIAVRIWPSSTYTRVTLESGIALTFRHQMLISPNRLVIDIFGLTLNSVLQNANKLVKQDDPYLKGIRVSQFDKKTVRIVFDLKQPLDPAVFTLQPVAKFSDRLVIDLYPKLSSVNDDPLLALLQEYNHGDLNIKQPNPVVTHPSTPQKKKKSWVIMIDPGHGGEDPGAIGKKGTREKDVVLSISRRLQRLINQDPKMKAYMTRNDDVFIPLEVRTAKAHALHADLFISVHADAFQNRSASGSSIYALSRKGATSSAARYLANTQNESDLIGGVSVSGDHYLDYTIVDLMQTSTINDSLLLGKKILNHFKTINKLHKNGVEQARFVVLQAPDIPSLLIETAFISNLQEENKLRTSKFQQQIAQAVYSGIKAFLASDIIKNRENF